MIKLLFTAILAMACAVSAYCEQYAVVVGINGYKNARTLTCAAGDAIDFAACLKSPQQGGVKSDNMTILQDQMTEHSITRASIMDSLKKTCSRTKAGDRIIFFFSGHGVTSNGRTFYVPRMACEIRQA